MLKYSTQKYSVFLTPDWGVLGLVDLAQLSDLEF